MNEREIIFISANPDIYPLEYYDKVSGEYKGVIPDLFSEFCEEYYYKVVYLNHEGKDERLDDFKDSQADIVSGVSFYDEFKVSESDELYKVMTSDVDGEEFTVSILVTDRASKEFKDDFNEFMNLAYDNKYISSLLYKSRVNGQQATNKMSTYFGINMFFVFSIFVIIIILFINKIKKLKNNEYIDSETGLNNYYYLVDNYRNLISVNTRVLYYVIYIEPDTDTIYRISNRSSVEKYFKHIVAILDNYTNKDDVVVKLTNDKFLVLKMAINYNEISAWMQTIMNAIQDFSEKYHENFQSRAWAGLYRLKKTDEDIDRFIEQAKYSCYYAKENNKDFAKCTSEIYDQYYKKNMLEERVKTGLNKNEFVPYMQFIVDAKTRTIKGAEILSRWKHPYVGILYPESYLDVMEKNNYIQYLDFAMLEDACQILESIYENDNDKLKNFFITCNFSKLTISSVDFEKLFTDIVRTYNFPHKALVIEVNALRNSIGPISTSNTHIIKEFGAQLVLDDFGTGYLEMGKYGFEKYDGIKTDKTIVRNIEHDSGKNLIHGFQTICKNMSIESYAEGVTNEEQCLILNEYGYDYIQGDYIYSPIPVEEAFDILGVSKLPDFLSV